MRRIRDRRPSTLFRGGELTRLLSMVVMLLVLGMMMRKAKDEDTWRFFSGEPRGLATQSEARSAPAVPPRETHARRSARLQAESAAAAEQAARLAMAAAPSEPIAEQQPAPAEVPGTDTAAAENAVAEDRAAGSPPESADQAPETGAGSQPPKSEPHVPLDRPHLPSHPEQIHAPGTVPTEPPEKAFRDEDPEEVQQFERESSVLVDHAPLTPDEMFAYWRLMRWEQDQTVDEMRGRARGDVRFGDLITEPKKHRGDLIKVKLHVIQVLKFDDLPENPLGIRSNYQAAGWNDSSQAWFYLCVFTDLPQDMPTGDRVYEEGTFVGYFLKTITYEDGQGKRIKAPVLIGKMVYHPRPVAARNKDEWMWPWLVGGVLAVLFVARWGWRFFRREPEALTTGLLRRGDRMLGPAGEDEIPIEDWLEQVESQDVQAGAPPDTAIKPRAEHDFNGNARPNGLHNRPDHGVDWTERPER